VTVWGWPLAGAVATGFLRPRRIGLRGGPAVSQGRVEVPSGGARSPAAQGFPGIGARGQRVETVRNGPFDLSGSPAGFLRLSQGASGRLTASVDLRSSCGARGTLPFPARAGHVSITLHAKIAGGTKTPARA